MNMGIVGLLTVEQAGHYYEGNNPPCHFRPASVFFVHNIYKCQCRNISENESHSHHTRIPRTDIPSPEIDPALRAFGRHIAKSVRKRRGVHIPAMKNDAFGQVLRSLELTRAFN